MSQVFHRSSSSMRRVVVVRDLSSREVDVPSFTSETAGLARRAGGSEPSTTVKVLAVFVVLFGLTLLGVLIWRVGKWRRERIRKQAVASSRINKYFEKPAGMIEVNFGTEKKSFFARPLMLSRPAPSHSLNKAVKKGTTRFMGGIQTAVSKVKPNNSSQDRSPSPPYPTVYAETSVTEHVPSAVTTYPITRVPSNKSIKSVKADLRVDVEAQPVTLELLTAKEPKTTVLSPRTSSHFESAPGTARTKSIRSANGKRLPRLMIVTSTFIPSLPDELLIKVGEPLRLIEEYEDEWCLVQRVGKEDAEKGVIPRFCLHERPEILNRPTHHKKASSAVLPPYQA
ncbi:hypothetical protein BXZ70DRAFT_239795 [Cristinia sonorae]|uniref:SH3 domain-containing protein n=1 Tax=Cristinia sonorae TaxID=1940300 RepID=A0A8K0XP63_9AGAR|nr:hypothetical protein BXZ70DRAFT_239795 [Cristinia sonorae]